MKHKITVLAIAATFLAVAVIGAIVLSSAGHATATVEAAAPNTARVERGKLSAVVSEDGILTYRSRPDGSPYSVINEASGVYTELPEIGDEIDCGDVLYRVNEHPVLLLCGVVPAYRTLQTGDSGEDVRQLNGELHKLGYDAKARVHIEPNESDFTANTQKALETLQRSKKLHISGALASADVVFLPASVRIAKISAQPGEPARPGVSILSATSDVLDVQVNFEPSQQGQVKKGDQAQIALPGNVIATGKVIGFGRIAEAAGAQDSGAVEATITTYIRLVDPSKARGLDRAPVQVDITTAGVESALSVPVTALVGRSGGGFAVEAVRDGTRRELVAVTVGLFDTADGRVQVQGDLRPGDRVVVPSV